MTPDFIVDGRLCLTMDAASTIVENPRIRIRKGKILSIEDRHHQNKNNPEKPDLDASDCLLVPGFINGHTHVGMSLFRGVADDLPLDKWLNEIIFPLERKWSKPDFVRLGTQVAAMELLRSGVTTFNDMYYFEEETARVVDEVGMRAVCGQTVIESHGVEASLDLDERFRRLLEVTQKYPRVIPSIAPHAIYSVGRDVWEKVLQIASDRSLRIHFHFMETPLDEEMSLRSYGRRPIDFFEELGLWSFGRVTVAHVSCATQKDIDILGKYNIGVSYNPESNLKLGTQICPVVELRQAGCSVAIGTDSTASNNNLDILQEIDIGAKLQSFRSGVGKLTAYDAVGMLTIEGSRALGLSDTIGSLEPGKEADIVAINLGSTHAIPLFNPYSYLVYSASSQDVKHTIVGGKLLMKDRCILTLDEDVVLNAAVEWGKKIGLGLPRRPPQHFKTID